MLVLGAFFGITIGYVAGDDGEKIGTTIGGFFIGITIFLMITLFISDNVLVTDYALKNYKCSIAKTIDENGNISYFQTAKDHGTTIYIIRIKTKRGTIVKTLDGDNIVIKYSNSSPTYIKQLVYASDTKYNKFWGTIMAINDTRHFIILPYPKECK